MKSHKLYKRVFYHFTYLRKEMQGDLPHYEFKLNVAIALMYGERYN